jgi:hypothetical protein
MPSAVRTTTELANRNLVKTLVKHSDVSSEEKSMLFEYAKRIKNGVVEIDYNYSKRIQTQQKTGEILKAYGRLYAQKNGMARFSRRVRATIAQDNYVDIDMQNAHMSLLSQFLAKHKKKELYPALFDYVENRDTHLNNLMQLEPNWTRKEAKQLYLRLAYGGSSFVHCEEINAKFEDLPEHVGQFENEIKLASDWVSKTKCDETAMLNELKVTNRNLSGSTRIKQSSYLSCVLSSLEDKCLQAMIKYFEANSLPVDVLLFDGAMVRSNAETVEQHLSGAEDYISKETGYKMKLEIKPFETPYEIVYENRDEDDTVLTYKYEGEYDILDEGIDLTSYKPALAHELPFTDLRDRYRRLKKYFEYFCAYCQDPPCYLFKNNPMTDVKPLMMNKEQMHMMMQMMPKIANPFNDKNQSFMNAYAEDPHKLTYKKMDFMPYAVDSDKPDTDIYNLFVGFPRHCYITDSYACVNPFTDLVWALSGEDKECYEYMLNWLANILQHPSKKARTAIVLSGNQGIGKNVFTTFLSHLIGREYCYESSSPDQLFGKYAEGRQNKLLTIANEMELKGTANYEGTIKASITDDTCSINPKGIRSYNVNAYDSFIITSNKPDPIPIDTGSVDRRFTLMVGRDFMNKMSGDECKDFVKRLYSEEMLTAVYNYLMRRDLTSVNLKVRPLTDHIKNLYDVNTHPVMRFISHMFHSEESWTAAHPEIKWNEPYEFENRFIHAKLMDANKYSGGAFDKVTPIVLGKYLVYNAPVRKRRTNQGTNYIITPAEYCEHLRKNMPYLFE